MFDAGRHLSRRDFARISAATVATLLASGCRQLRSDATLLRFWNGFTGPDGRTILKIIRKFNALHDDVQIVMQRMEWGTYYNKLFVAGMAGRAPEIFVVHTDNLERFMRARFIAPIGSIFGTNGIDRSDFDLRVITAVERDGIPYGLPIDCHPAGTFYNRKLFADAGIAKPPETRDEFIQMLHKLKKIDAGDGLPQWGFVYEWARVACYTLIRQFGGDIVAPDAKTIIFDSLEVREALTFAGSLIHEFDVAPPVENLDAFLGFRQGRVGMVWAGIFKLNDVTRQTDLDYGAAPIAICGGRSAVWAGSHNLCLRAALGERERAAAEQFLKFMSDNTLDWAEGGQVPVRPSLRESDRFKAMTVQSEFARQLPYIAYMPSTLFTFEYQTEFDRACERVLRNAATPAVATREAAANMRKAAAYAATIGGAA